MEDLIGDMIQIFTNIDVLLDELIPASYNLDLEKVAYKLKSWQNELKTFLDAETYQEELNQLKEVEKYSKEVFRRSQAESWAVNINVHYNRWADFSVADFRPVVKAFYDLFGLFKCDKCDGILHLNKNGMELEAVRCNCGAINWNLVRA